MLLGSQGCGYLEQRLQNHLRERSELEQQHQRTTGQTPTSLFTIDSILAQPSKSIDTTMLLKTDNSPSSSPPANTNASPVRPTRVPAMLHPGLHLGHLAAAAASGFGNPSEFLGEKNVFGFGYGFSLNF